MSARTEPVKAKARSPSAEEDGGVSGAGAWLDAHYDPVASLYTFSTCIALENLNRDGDHKLLVGDLGNGHLDMKLKVYKGTELSFETPLLDLPSGVITFYMDTTDPRTPAVAVAAGPFVYVYKNLRPYFKFALPHLELNADELELWTQVKQGRIGAQQLQQSLRTIQQQEKKVPLSVQSLKFLQLEKSDLQPFISTFRHAPLKRQSVITAMQSLKKSHSEDDAVSCLVVASENGDVYVLDPEAFTVLKQFLLPSQPVFLSVTGLYDVDYNISAACRDNCIYTFKSGSTTPQYNIPLASQPCGLVRINKDIVVGCMDNTLTSYSHKGKKQWSLHFPATIMSVEVLYYKPRSFKAVLVALQNGDVRIYKDKFLVNHIKMDDVVVGMKFGQFGREDGVLIMVTRGGALSVKILKRSVNFEVKDMTPGPPASQLDKLNIPKRTKVYVDQMAREKESGTAMHCVFQQDLSRLKLNVTRAYAKAVTSNLTPLTSTPDISLKISAQVQGLGPIFRLTVTVQNTSPSKPVIGHYITFKCDESLYRISKKFIQMPLLVPSLSYNFDTMVECTDDMGRTEDISVYVVKNSNSAPLITAVLNMPVSENIIVT
jgi:Bardet-Biedl syndrome 1 protein